MRLKIIDSNFTTNHNWLFKLISENGDEIYIMNEGFYKKHNLKSPVSKKELDYYDKGQWITATIIEINGKQIVNKI